MRHIIFLVIITVALYGLEKNARAETLTCIQENLTAIAQNNKKAVETIRIGQYRADMALMDNSLKDLEAQLDECSDHPEWLSKICDSNCHKQRASVHLFRATALPLLSSTSDKTAWDVSEATQYDEAQKGLDIVRQALDSLPRLTGFDEEGDGLQRFIKAYAGLTALRAKLLMTKGDIWYRNASASQVKAVAHLVNDVLSSGAVYAGDADDNTEGDLQSTAAYYDEAYWCLLEAMTSLPNEDAASAIYAAEKNEIATLQDLLKNRIQSLNEGKIYIGIDPGNLGSGEKENHRGLESLSKQLFMQLGKLEEIETGIDSNLDDWAFKMQNYEGAVYEQEQTKNARQIELEVYKIQGIEQQASLAAEALSTQLGLIDVNAAQFEYEHQINEALMMMDRGKLEFDSQISLIEQQTEREVMALNRENTQLELEDTRFGIDLTLAKFNFDMQAAALKREQQELVGRLTAGENELKILNARTDQVNADIALEQKRIDYADNAVSKIREQQETMLINRASAIQFQIDAIQKEIDFYSLQGSSLAEQICQKRSELSAMTLSDLEGIAQRDGDLKSLIDANYHAVRNSRIDSQDRLKEMVQLAQTRLKELLVKKIEWASLVAPLDAIVTAAHAASAAAAFIPDCRLGMITGLTCETTGVADKVADAALKAAQSARGAFADTIQFSNGIHQEQAQLLQAVEDAHFRLEEISTQNVAEAAAMFQTLAEIDIRLLEVSQQYSRAEVEQAMQTMECSLQGFEKDMTVAKLQATQSSLQYEKTAISDESALLEYEVIANENMRSQSAIAITRLGYQLDELDAERKKVSDDMSQVSKMLTSVASQLKQVEGYRASVKEQIGDYQKQLAALKGYIEEMKLTIEGHGEEQKAFLAQILDQDATISISKIEALETLALTKTQSSALLNTIQSLKNDAYEKIAYHRDNIVGLIETAPQSGTPQVIWDFQSMIAQLSRGAREMLAQKQLVLENFNYYYNLYRQRYNMLSSFVGGSGIADDAAVIWTADQAWENLFDCYAESEVCHPNSLINNGHSIYPTYSVFNISNTSALFTTLLRDKTVRFEFSPAAVDKTYSRALGYLAMWDKLNMSQESEMRVIGISLGFPGLTQCTPTEVNIRHEGLGYQFESTTTGYPIARQALMKPVQGRPHIFTGANSWEEQLAGAKEYTTYTYDILALEAKLQQHLNPFAGYPLAGAYEITIDDESTASCLAEATQMDLNVIYARR